MSFYQLPETLDSEIRDFEGQIKEYQDGELNPIAFKGIRVAHGVYEQRKPETHMVRIRCGAGGITPAQLRHVGDLARRYGSGEIHVTTRQEIQLHYVALENVIRVYDELVGVGLSSRGGGGNTIRNILANHDSGVSPDEVFDVAPYAVALTTRMIAEADSWNLPRKFKIAFSNRDEDTIRATLTCLGFIARIQDGQKGFKVYVAGGMGANPMPGKVLFDWVPEQNVYHVAKAAKLMFDKHGNRRRRSIARIKFLWDKLGETDFKARFHEEYDQLVRNQELALELPDLTNEAQVREGYQAQTVSGTAFETWKKRYASEQKQKGLFQIEVPLALGDIDGNDANRIADVLENFGDNVLRFSVFQNLHFRNIPEAYLGNIFNLLQSIHSLSSKPAMFGKMIACTGADTCKLGIALPRGATPTIQALLEESGLDLDQLADVKLHISGCPNTCGCHHAADLGFFGKVMRVGKDLLPAYNILSGAILIEGNTRFSRKVDEVSARDLPVFVKNFLTTYLEHKANYANFTEYVDDRGDADITAICDQFRNLPSLKDNSDYYFDWGAEEQFSLLKGQKAECSAGMFDMIDVDSRTIRESIKAAKASQDREEKLANLSTALFSSSRMLLVTRGLEPKSDGQMYENFIQHFIKTDLIPQRFTDLILAAKAADHEAILEREDEIADLADHLHELYKNMDDSLRFKQESQPLDLKSLSVSEALPFLV